jgi:biotin synthase-related radical SAM superfamily protein
VKTFKDNKGREWKIEVTVATIKRVRDLLEVDLLELLEGKLIERLIRDPVLLCNVVYAVCRPQAEAEQITDEDFGAAMAGDAIDNATKALLEELVNFSPSPKDRANLIQVLETTWAAMDRARELIAEKIAGGEVTKAIEQALAELGPSSGSSPVSSDSTPAP